MRTLADEAKQPDRELRRYSYDELMAEMPETNLPHELWDGELIMAPAPRFEHQKVALRFYRLLEDWTAAHDLGETIASPIDMVLSAHQTAQPDVAFVSRQRLHIIQGAIRGPADLVAEVVSPGSRNRDCVEKRDLYERHGVPEYWLIDPELETVEVLSLVDSAYQLVMRYRPGQMAASRLLPGFEVAVRRLFGGK